jgi:hypothetical protein
MTKISKEMVHKMALAGIPPERIEDVLAGRVVVKEV